MSTGADAGPEGSSLGNGPDGTPAPGPGRRAPMARPGLPQPRGNRLLSAMTLTDRLKLDRVLEPVTVPPGEVLFRDGWHIGQVHFPEAGTVISLRASLPEGGVAEVGLVGPEGVVGLSAVLGLSTAPFHAVVLVGGVVLRMPATELRERANASFPLRDLLQRYSAARLATAARQTACAMAHPLRGRLAAWILMVGDRAGPGFPVTQQTLAEALGARRPTVNAIVQDMQRSGLLRLARGQISVSDMDGLAAAACACHIAGREVFRSLLPLSSPQPGVRSTAFRNRPFEAEPAAPDTP